MTLDSETRKPIVLTFVRHYLPGYRYGGPVPSIANLVQCLGDEFCFKIVTSDREPRESVRHEGVTPDIWNRVGKADVYYCSPENRSLRSFRRLITETPHDIVYLNSFFDPTFTIRPLLLLRYGLVPERPLVLAPRGELSRGALGHKTLKKNSYVRFAKTLGFYKRLIWQASTELEAQEIRAVMYVDQKRIAIAENIFVAPDVKLLQTVEDQHEKTRQKAPGALRVLFLSLITSKKNLEGALRSLDAVKVDVEFNIYGPVADENCWKRCRELMRRLPPNISAVYRGGVTRDKVLDIMGQHDLFFLPTHGENFGHVILEALSTGTPVLISDRTPWNGLEEAGAGWNLPIDDTRAFASVIELAAGMDSQSYQRMRKNAVTYALTALGRLDAVGKNRELLLRAFQNSGASVGCPLIQERL